MKATRQIAFKGILHVLLVKICSLGYTLVDDFFLEKTPVHIFSKAVCWSHPKSLEITIDWPKLTKLKLGQ